MRNEIEQPILKNIHSFALHEKKLYVSFIDMIKCFIATNIKEVYEVNKTFKSFRLVKQHLLGFDAKEKSVSAYDEKGELILHVVGHLIGSFTYKNMIYFKGAEGWLAIDITNGMVRKVKLPKLLRIKAVSENGILASIIGEVITAIEVKSGTPLWKKKSSDFSTISKGNVFYDKIEYYNGMFLLFTSFNNKRKIHAIDDKSGNTIWEVSNDYNQFQIHENQIYLLENEKTSVLSLEDGQLINEILITPETFISKMSQDCLIVGNEILITADFLKRKALVLEKRTGNILKSIDINSPKDSTIGHIEMDEVNNSLFVLTGNGKNQSGKYLYKYSSLT